jgi:predicted lipase
MVKQRAFTKQEARRMREFPNTSVFQWENLNPKGHITGDCTVRAVAGAIGISWEAALTGLRDFELKYARMDMVVFTKYLASFRWVKHKQPVKEDGKKYMVYAFARYLTKQYPNGEIGNVICTTSHHHMTCIKPVQTDAGVVYKIHDHWNCQNNVVGNFWTKQM